MLINIPISSGYAGIEAINSSSMPDGRQLGRNCIIPDYSEYASFIRFDYFELVVRVLRRRVQLGGHTFLSQWQAIV